MFQRRLKARICGSYADVILSNSKDDYREAAEEEEERSYAGRAYGKQKEEDYKYAA